MKILTREFTLREKILLVILVLAIMILSYFQFFYFPMEDAIASARSEAENLQIELGVVEDKVLEMRAMKDELDSMMEDGTIARMESYNNAKSELAFLNDVLAPTQEYVLSIADVTREGDQIRRNISLQFSVNTYSEVEQILVQLENCPYRCIVRDVSVSSYEGGLDSMTVIKVSALATFYETMVGGTEDVGLPVEQSSNH